jgi:hypothetical protein
LKRNRCIFRHCFLKISIHPFLWLFWNFQTHFFFYQIVLNCVLQKYDDDEGLGSVLWTIFAKILWKFKLSSNFVRILFNPWWKICEIKSCNKTHLFESHKWEKRSHITTWDRPTQCAYFLNKTNLKPQEKQLIGRPKNML